MQAILGVFLPPSTPLPPSRLILPQLITPKMADMETAMFRTTGNAGPPQGSTSYLSSVDDR